MKNRLDLARLRRRSNADSTFRATRSNAHCTCCASKSHAVPARLVAPGREMRLSWGFVARTRLLCENECSLHGACNAATKRAIGAAGAQVPYKDKVGGSNPSSPTTASKRGRRMFRRPLFRSRTRTNVSRETSSVEALSSRAALVANRDATLPPGVRTVFASMLRLERVAGASILVTWETPRRVSRWRAKLLPERLRRNIWEQTAQNGGERGRKRAPSTKRPTRGSGRRGARPPRPTHTLAARGHLSPRATHTPTARRAAPAPAATCGPSEPSLSCRGWRRQPLPRGTGWPPSRTARSGGGTSRTARA